ncbi:MAG: EpsG family protein [Oscillospiraceae bacterium]|nr:EpsG family protein [Oscillospiraceae bacterium]
MEYIKYLLSPVYGYSICIYTALFFIVTYLAFISQKKEENTPEEAKRKLLYFSLSFILVWFFYVFNNTGTDLPVYINIYDSSQLDPQWINANGLEKGYRVINALLHLVIKDPYIGIGLLKTVQITLVYICIYIMRDKINLGYSIMGYMALFYFQSFNLIRLSLAGSICLLSFVLVYNKKYLLSIIIGIAAATIHTTAVIFLFAVLFYAFYNTFKMYKTLWLMNLLLVIPIIIVFGRRIIISILMNSNFIERYNSYTEDTGSIGVMQIIFYLPAFIMFFIISRAGFKENERITDLCYILTLFGFAVAMLGYSIGLFARMSFYFAQTFIVFMPYYIQNRSEIIRNRTFRMLSPGTFSGVITFYWIFRFVTTISGLFIPSGLSEYKLVFK